VNELASLYVKDHEANTFAEKLTHEWRAMRKLRVALAR